MKIRFLLFAAVALLAALPLLGDESPSVDLLKIEQTGQVDIAQDQAVPSEASEPACETAELAPSTGPFEEMLASAAASCSGTTSCGRPFSPVWNAYCNNWCLSMGYYGGACGSNRCCLCIAEG